MVPRSKRTRPNGGLSSGHVGPLAITVRTAVRCVGATVPDALQRRLPAGLERRVATWKRWQVDRPYLPPDTERATDNVAYNRSIWDWYAERWSDPDFRRKQLSYDAAAGDDPETLVRLGEEWGNLKAVRQVVADWIAPHVDGTSVAGEIGTGGGRVAALVAPTVGSFHAFDISSKMLDRVRDELRSVANARFHFLADPALPDELAGRMDFVYSFDVFVHLDLHVQWRYFQEIERVLRPGGKAFVHTANLTTDEGWRRFARQEQYRVEGFYFVVPEVVRTLAERAGLLVVVEGSPTTGNFYYERDHLVLLEKPASAGR